MQKISSKELKKGMIVKYIYSVYEHTGTPAGPFKVAGFHRDHEGEHVLLHGLTMGKNERRVSLAVDVAFGFPIFYQT